MAPRDETNSIYTLTGILLQAYFYVSLPQCLKLGTATYIFIIQKVTLKPESENVCIVNNIRSDDKKKASYHTLYEETYKFGASLSVT